MLIHLNRLLLYVSCVCSCCCCYCSVAILVVCVCSYCCCFGTRVLSRSWPYDWSLGARKREKENNTLTCPWLYFQASFCIFPIRSKSNIRIICEVSWRAVVHLILVPIVNFALPDMTIQSGEKADRASASKKPANSNRITNLRNRSFTGLCTQWKLERTHQPHPIIYYNGYPCLLHHAKL